MFKKPDIISIKNTTKTPLNIQNFNLGTMTFLQRDFKDLSVHNHKSNKLRHILHSHVYKLKTLKSHVT